LSVCTSAAVSLNWSTQKLPLGCMRPVDRTEQIQDNGLMNYSKNNIGL